MWTRRLGRGWSGFVGLVLLAVFALVWGSGSAVAVPVVRAGGGSGAAVSPVEVVGPVGPDSPVVWRAARGVPVAPVVASKPKDPVYPKPGKATVRVPKTHGSKAVVGETAVSVMRPAKEKPGVGGRDPGAGVPDAVTVDVADFNAAARLGGIGVAFTVAAAPGSGGGDLGVSVDVSGFASAFGGGLASRLRVAQVPVCQLDAAVAGVAPGPECPEVLADPVATVLDGSAMGVSADVTVPDPAGSGRAGAVVGEGAAAAFVVMSVAAGSESNFAATSVTTAGSWSVGVGSGDYQYSYPLPVAPPRVGGSPALGLAYSSGSVDGMTAGDNGQAPLAGTGWSMGEAFIEQLYGSYTQSAGRSDFQYDGDKFRIVLNGHASMLVKASFPGGCVSG